jgi:predicted transposase/invertase (TIGR01784 family)
MSLINSMLPLKQPVVEIEYNTNELIPELTQTLRNTIVDVRCTAKDGRQFIVEMQMYWTESFKSRVLLNASKAYVMQFDKTKNFKLLKPVYALNFVNTMFEKSQDMKDKYYHHYKIVNIDHTEKQIEGLEFLFVELPKFKPQNRAEKKLHDLWLRFLTEINETTTEIPQELLENELIREAVNYMEMAAYSKEQLEAYDKWNLAVMTERSAISDAKDEGLAEGLVEGRAEGLVEGRVEGEVIGLEKGKIEGKIEVAKSLSKMGIPLSQIIDATGLSENEINQI